MQPNTIDIISGAVRTIAVGLLWWFISKGDIGGDFVGTVIGSVVTLGVIVWSVMEKQGTAATFFSQAMGAGRNLLTALLTFAAGRGWIEAQSVGAIVAAIGSLAVIFWSAESKVLAAKASRYAIPLLCVALALPMLVACADVATPQGALNAAHDLYVAAETGYTATCVAYPTFPICTADDQAKAKQAEMVADAAFTTAQDAINAGSLSDTAIMKLVSDFIQDAAVIEGLFNQGEQMKAAMHPTVWYRVSHPSTWHS